MSLADRVLTYVGTAVYNPKTVFGPASKMLDVLLPQDGKRRAAEWSCDLYTDGPWKSQVELVVGGQVWDRANVALPQAGVLRVGGRFDLQPLDSSRHVVLRVRSYDKGANAVGSNPVLHALDVTGVEYAVCWQLDTGIGSNTPTTRVTQAGVTEDLAIVGLSGIPGGRYAIAATCDVQPQGGSALLTTWGDGHLLEPTTVPGPVSEHYPAVKTWFLDTVEAGTREWRLKIKASENAPCRTRRQGLFVVNWDQIEA